MSWSPTGCPSTASDADGRRWRRSPGGLVTALEPVMRKARRRVGRLGGPARPASSSRSSTTASDLIPVPLARRRPRELLRGLLQRHPLAALPRRDRAARAPPRRGGTRTCGSTGASPRRPPTPQPRARPSGCRTTSCSWCRGCCASCAPTCVIGFFNHIPFPAYGIFSQLPWRRQIIEGLLGADVIGFQRAADAGNFSRAVRRLLGYPTQGHGHRGARTATGAPRRRRWPRPFPISIDVGGVRGARRRATTSRRGRRRSARASATRRRSCSASTGSTTPRASGTGSRRSASCSPRGGSRVEDVTLVQVASPSRERVEATSSCATRSS